MSPARLAVALVLSAFLPMWCAADEVLICPALTNEQFPSLLLSQPAGGRGTELLLAWFDGKSARRQTLFSSPHRLSATRLDDTLLLLTEVDYLKPRGVSIMELGNGTIKRLAEDSWLRCVRSEPDRKKAMLMTVDPGAIEVELIELDLKTLELKPRCRVPARVLGLDGMDGLGANALAVARLSPDFARLAFVTPFTSTNVEGRGHRYDLKTIDLDSMKVTKLVEGIFAELPALSSQSRGFPVFEWLGSEEILYQDMIPGPADEVIAANRIHVLKTVKLSNHVCREFLRQDLTLAPDGGCMRFCPFSGRLLYQADWVIDVPKRQLAPRLAPYAIKAPRGLGETRITERDKTLYAGDGSCVGDCVSSSGWYLAYALRPAKKDGNAQPIAVYAKIKGSDSPVRMAEARSANASITPLFWIEHTQGMRRVSEMSLK